MKTLARFQKPQIVIVAAFLLLWALLSKESYPTWDAAYYYAYTRSVAFDGDLKIDNDLRLSYPTATADFVNKGYDRVKTETGRVESPYAIGSSLIWLPGLVFLRGAVAVGQSVNVLAGQLSGYEWYFAPTISAFSALLGLLAFWLGYRVASPETSKFSALASVLTLLFATPLIYYQFFEPLYSHATSAFVNGLVVYIWWRSYRQNPSYMQAILLGGAIGLAGLVRWQNVTYIFLPLVTTIWWWLDMPASDRRLEWKRAIVSFTLLGLTILVVLSLQFSHWRLLYGSSITVPQGDSFMNLSAHFWIQVLFSPLRGLLSWMPVTFLAVLGLLLMAKKRTRLVFPLLILLLATLYVNSSSQDCFGGGGYGPRRFSSELVVFILGYSGLIEAIQGRVRKPIVAILGLGLVFHQWILLRFGLEERIGGRVMSMYPEYRWSEVSYEEFLKSIARHFSDIIASPRDFFVQPLSPLGELLDGRWPGSQFFTLLAAAVILLLIWLLFEFIRTRDYATQTYYYLGAIVVVAFILIANIWILNWA
ncbi:MAG TPA: hypothetical protein VMZ24_01020 [Patescibacteria group bacterium]|nr:hypothetical protein [Patescibacteria group bacterium]